MSWRASLMIVGSILALAVPAMAQQGRVTGRLNLGEATVPPQAQVEVMLLDISQSKVSSLLISQKKYAVGDDPSVPFTLTYDKAKIDATHDYAVSARILLDGHPRFMADKKAPVITKGNPINIEIPMRAVARSTKK